MFRCLQPWITFLAVLALLGGCATPARVQQMVAANAGAAQQAVPEYLRASVGVKEVSGGRETNPMWMSQVGSAEFERALEESLRQAGMLSPARTGGRYLLTADLRTLDQPLIGINFTVTATVDWLMVERSTGREVLRRTLSTPHTARMSDAFMAVERLKLANEGAIRRNIESLIEAVLALPVAATP